MREAFGPYLNEILDLVFRYSLASLTCVHLPLFSVGGISFSLRKCVPTLPDRAEAPSGLSEDPVHMAEYSAAHSRYTAHRAELLFHEPIL